MPSDKEKLNCKSKKRFATDAEARSALAHLKSKPGKHPSRVYKCPVCFGYHLTSKPKL
jgi:hypothetical protein